MARHRLPRPGRLGLYPVRRGTGRHRPRGAPRARRRPEPGRSHAGGIRPAGAGRRPAPHGRHPAPRSWLRAPAGHRPGALQRRRAGHHPVGPGLALGGCGVAKPARRSPGPRAGPRRGRPLLRHRRADRGAHGPGGRDRPDVPDAGHGGRCHAADELVCRAQRHPGRTAGPAVGAVPGLSLRQRDGHQERPAGGDRAPHSGVQFPDRRAGLLFPAGGHPRAKRRAARGSARHRTGGHRLPAGGGRPAGNEDRHGDRPGHGAVRQQPRAAARAGGLPGLAAGRSQTPPAAHVADDAGLAQTPA